MTTVTYDDLKRKGHILQTEDSLTLHGIQYRVVKSGSLSHYWLSTTEKSGGMYNDAIFDILNLNISEFLSKLFGSSFYTGVFPEMDSAEKLTKLVIALYEQPMFHPGDEVQIAEYKEDVEYPFGFTDYMRKLSGNQYTIKRVDTSSGSIKHTYILEGAGFYWSENQLILVKRASEVSEDTAKEQDVQSADTASINYVTLDMLKAGYVFKEADHIQIGLLDCIINSRFDSRDETVDRRRYWISLERKLEDTIYDELEISREEKNKMAEKCGAASTYYSSPEFKSLEDLSKFVKGILMYKKKDETPSKKKWSGNPTYFDLIDGRILEKYDILNIHGIKYSVSDGGSDSKRCWLTASGVRNSIIFEKLGIKDKVAFVTSICPIVSKGDFPEVCSFEDLTKVAIALFQVSEFKKGDKVKVVHREDDEDDYPWSFTDEMTALGDKIYTIKKVELIINPQSGKANERLSEDPFCYYLDTGSRDFQWHSSMLEKVSESDKKSEESSKEESSSKSSRISLSDLQSGYILKGGDTVVLCGETYKVYCCNPYFLYNVSGGFNDSVFDKLGIEDKMYFCSIYGTVSSGAFPEFKRLEDLTACVKQLMILEKMRDCKGDSGDTSSIEVIKAERLNFVMDISESDEPSDTGTVRLPEIKDDFKIIL